MITKSWLKIIDIHFLTVLKARHLNRVSVGMGVGVVNRVGLFGDFKRVPVPGLFQSLVAA